MSYISFYDRLRLLIVFNMLFQENGETKAEENMPQHQDSATVSISFLCHVIFRIKLEYNGTWIQAIALMPVRTHITIISSTGEC